MNFQAKVESFEDGSLFGLTQKKESCQAIKASGRNDYGEVPVLWG